MKLFTLWILFLNPQGIVERSEPIAEYYGTYGYHLCIKKKQEAEQYWSAMKQDIKADCRMNNLDPKSIEWDDVYISS